MSLIAAPFAILAILYAGGFLAQLLGNYATWKQGGGIPGDGTSPLAASPDFLLCLSSVLRPPYGVYGILICIGLLAVLLIRVMRMGYGDADEYDEDRNFSYSAKGTYGTSGWMSRKEMSGVLDLVPDLRKHKGNIVTPCPQLCGRHTGGLHHPLSFAIWQRNAAALLIIVKL